MLLTAVKEMNGKKGVSILSIYKYVSSIYRYDVQRNRSLLKRMLKCLIFEGLVKQIKGHGFSGTFTLGKNYREDDAGDKMRKQVTALTRELGVVPQRAGGAHPLRLLQADDKSTPLRASLRALTDVFCLQNISSIRVETSLWLPLSPEKSAWRISSTQIFIA